MQPKTLRYFLAIILVGLIGTTANAQSYWRQCGVKVAGGYYNIGDSGLKGNAGIYVDAVGYLYIADQFNSRVVKYAPGAVHGVVVAGGNDTGSALNHVNYPNDVFLDDSSNIFVSDGLYNRVIKFPPTSTSATVGTLAAGKAPLGLKTGGSSNDSLNAPWGLWVDNSHNLYVSSFGSDRVWKYPNTWPTTARATAAGCSGGGGCNGSKKCDGPKGIWMNGNGTELYVAQANAFKVAKWHQPFASGDSYTTVAGTGANSPSPNNVTPNAVFGIPGVGGDTLYVVEDGFAHVMRWYPGATTGDTIVTHAMGGSANTCQLNSPYDIYMTTNTCMYVSDYNNFRVLKFCKDSTFNVAVNEVASTFHDINLYPNPNTGSFTLQGMLNASVANMELNVTVLNMAGQVVYSKQYIIQNNKLFQEDVEFSDATPNGVYNVIINTGNERFTKRFVLQH